MPSPAQAALAKTSIRSQTARFIYSIKLFLNNSRFNELDYTFVGLLERTIRRFPADVRKGLRRMGVSKRLAKAATGMRRKP
jgi:hypothetical protein